MSSPATNLASTGVQATGAHPQLSASLHGIEEIYEKLKVLCSVPRAKILFEIIVREANTQVPVEPNESQSRVAERDAKTLELLTMNLHVEQLDMYAQFAAHNAKKYKNHPGMAASATRFAKDCEEDCLKLKIDRAKEFNRAWFKKALGRNYVDEHGNRGEGEPLGSEYSLAVSKEVFRRVKPNDEYIKITVPVARPNIEYENMEELFARLNSQG